MLAVMMLPFLGALVISALCTWKIRGVALQRGWVRGPASERHIHRVNMPRVGGVAIVGAVIAVGSMAAAGMLVFCRISKTSALGILAVCLASLVSFAAGLVDDFRELSPWVKLAAEVVAGTTLWCLGVRILHFSALFRNHQFGMSLSLLLTVAWVVLISNAFNLIDGVDGLAAGCALFSVFTVFVVSLITHNVVQSVLSVVLAGAILGFLRYNFNPATIYLGDCGSLFIGTFLAAMTLTGSPQQKSSTLVAVAIPLVAFGLPVVETTVSIFRRFLRGQSIFSADREHIHHKLLDRGWSQRQVVVVLYGVSAVFSVLSLALLTPGQAPLAIVLTVLGIGIVIGVQKLRYHEFDEIGRVARRAWEQRQVMVNNIAVRRGAERLAGCASWLEIREALEEVFANNDFDRFLLTITGEAHDALGWMHYWQRPLTRIDRRADAAHWSISLPLKICKGICSGSLELSRVHSGPLLLDINLLVADFRSELQSACRRAAHLDRHFASALSVQSSKQLRRSASSAHAS